ncbi:MAG TPA: cyclic-di-AMP receptor [Anaerolineae bacterium]|nr:cyclic-di-AMP receptor [Anaerolineae bacterium]HQK14049.1 cyclic-di-AMP receptor [Anaerolineae bacterium]
MRKMVMAIIPHDQANHVIEALIAAGYTATFTDSRGGMLRQAQEMLFIAVQEKDLDHILKIIRDNCRTQIELEPGEESPTGGFPTSLLGPQTTYIGGAVVFVWDLERFEAYR